MIRVRLTTRDGGHVTDVFVPSFRPPADVLMWGQRVFTFHRAIESDADPCGQEYREAFCFVATQEAK